MRMQPLEMGMVAMAELRVAEEDLASALSAAFAGQDEFPPVFATSRMVALMEVAAARVLAPSLDPGELSVGVTVDITHGAATPPGATVIATATLVRMEGKLFVFEVTAADDAGEIGRGTHKRAVITTARLLEGASRRQRR
jgi:fluoroacetyl-CoA thioesterase